MAAKSKSKTKISVNIDEDQLADDLKYIETGVKKIISQDDTGYLNAFFSSDRNDEGLLMPKKEFVSIFSKLHIQADLKKLPDFFYVNIKYSPIVLFKKWIFVVSNKKLLKVSERNKGYEADFYLMSIDGKFRLIQILTNIAHEKFLVSLYERKKTPELHINFSTFFDDSKKLVIYKDYSKDKVSSIKLKQKLTTGRLYPVEISYLKDIKIIKYRISVNRADRISYNIRLNRSAKAELDNESSKKDFKSNEDYRQEVVKIIKTFHKTKKVTNKFANISLGRVNKIPILINLSAKYKNTPVKINFNRNEELEIFDTKNLVIKTFGLSKKPKSNWLERK